ncbi:flagellar hook-associated protein 1 [Luteitalea sp. TBR-22]|uniref:flagellar hook-associated protein FlgK n=1 Tax=Luteitalea sp. TBR-22 TaxID=2802971 RepID=UPI001AF580B1|nr:flagellar hook-associated protein FlgK [Luteitalea sp. TBR-22]BCS33513.1 flagellar hook-associated protein 1 [Luteitalea sp. TBR-22]
MSLFGMLGMTSKALDAQRFGLDVTGNNLANVNTPGYTKRVADFGAVPPPDRFSAGIGVEVLGVRSMRDRLYDQRLYDESPLEQQQSAMAESLGLVEVALGKPGSSVDADLEDFFDAFAELAEAPTSATARQQVLSEGEALARAFNGMASRLTDAAKATDQRVIEDVESINELTTRIAALNKSIGSSPSSQTLHLRDEQTEAIKELSGILGTQVLELADGTVQISTRSGRPLVVGADSYALAAVAGMPSGYARVQAADGTDITLELTDGHLGGELHVRDTDIPGYQAQLDELAYAVATEVNTLHATGYDLNGNPGGNFFTPPTGVAGAAAALRMDATLMANPSLVAAAGIPSSGDNQVARKLADLRDASIVNGDTPAEAWTALVYDVGSDVSRAEAEQASRQEIVNQIEQLRDSVSGVSIDEEAAMMLRYQRAYEANARFFSVIDQTIETLLSLKR